MTVLGEKAKEQTTETLRRVRNAQCAQWESGQPIEKALSIGAIDNELALLGQAPNQDTYYILSLDHSVRNDWLLWWRPNGAGYTTNLLEAGTYSRIDAVTFQRGAPEKVKALPVALVDAKAVKQSMVPTERLHELKAWNGE